MIKHYRWIIFQSQLAHVTPFFITAHCRCCRRLLLSQPEQLQPKSINLNRRRRQIRGGVDIDDEDYGSSYESSASVTKGIVSYLTSLTNVIFGTSHDPDTRSVDEEFATLSTRAPTSPDELLMRIRKEYVENNYLWTGNLDTSCFTFNCTFTDPTLSFVGVDNYVKNVRNLVPIVNYLLGDENYSRSDLLDITLNSEDNYIETRWNMVGKLNKLFWRPKIDVIGRTKFWYQSSSKVGGDEAYQVYFYDEQWDIPAGLALLQLITTAGTIKGSSEKP